MLSVNACISGLRAGAAQVQSLIDKNEAITTEKCGEIIEEYHQWKSQAVFSCRSRGLLGVETVGARDEIMGSVQKTHCTHNLCILMKLNMS